MFARSVSRTALRTLHTSVLRLAEKSALEVQLRDGLKTAMKAKQKATVTVLKAAISDVTNAAKLSSNPNEPASQEMAVTAVRKALEKRKVAADEYAPGAPGAHAEMYAAMVHEMGVLDSMLPAAPSAEAVQSYIDEIVAGLGDSKNPKMTGTVMKALWERLGDARASVDKKDVARRVTEALK